MADVLPEILAAQRALIESGGRHEAIQSALARVGAVAEVDRVYVFEFPPNDAGPELAAQRYEWCSDRVTPQIDNPELQTLPVREAGYGRWLDSLASATPIYGRVQAFPEQERPLLLAQSIKSLLVLPIFVDGALWGFVGFDDCTSERDWSESEIDLLITISLALGIALAETDPEGLDRRTGIYLGMIARLFEVHSATFSHTSQEHLVERTQARIRVLVHSYRYFSVIGSESATPLPDYLRSLLPLFADLLDAETQLQLQPAGQDAANMSLDIERSLDIAVTLSEALAALSESQQREHAIQQLTILLGMRDRKIEIALQAYDRGGQPLPGATALDAMAQVLLRRIQERLRATIEPLTGEEALFKITVPI